MADPMAFLDIEAALTDLVAVPFETQARALSNEAAMVIERDKDPQAAAEVINTVDTKGIVRRALPKAKLLMVSALSLGAQLAGAEAGATVFDDELPEWLLPAVMSVYGQVNGRVLEDAVRVSGAQAVADIDAIEKDQYLGPDREFETVIKIDKSYAAALNKAVNNKGRLMSSIAANLTTSRLVNFGFLSQARAGDYDEYRLDATIDRRTSKICRALDGKVFKVGIAYEHLKRVLQVTDPDELKSIAPWIKGNRETIEQLETLNEAELQDKFGVMVPPFHANCRTILTYVRRFTPVREQTVEEQLRSILDEVEATAPKPVALPDPPPPPALADFTANRINIDPAKLPDAFKAAFPSLSTPQQIGELATRLRRVMPGSDAQVIANYIEVGGGKSYLSFKVFTSDVKLTRSFLKKGDDLVMYGDLLQVSAGLQGQGLARPLLRQLLREARDMGVTKLEMLANLERGAYAWARAGYVPKNPDEFRSQMTYIVNDAVKKGVIDAESGRKMRYILETADDIDVAYDISSLRIGSRKVMVELMDTYSYDAQLFLNEAKAMARYEAYLNG